MVALDIIAFAAVAHGANEDGFEGAIVVAGVGFGSFGVEVVAEGDEVEDCCGKFGDVAAFLAGDIAGHGEGFEIDFRSHDGRADVEEDAAFEMGDGFCEN